MALSAQEKYGLAKAMQSQSGADQLAAVVAGSGLTPSAVVAALTDSSGGAAADSTIGAITAPTAITDNTTGTTTATFAAGVGVYDLVIPSTFKSGTSAEDYVTGLVVGHKFKILSWEYISEVIGVGASASRVFNLEIGTTDVGTVASTVTLTEAATDTKGERVAGTTVTGANTGTASDAISLEVAAGGTQFTAGSGVFVIKIQNMDTADAVAGICTAQAANLLAIVALKDAIKELATKQNAVLTSLKNANVMASA